MRKCSGAGQILGEEKKSLDESSLQCSEKFWCDEDEQTLRQSDAIDWRKEESDLASVLVRKENFKKKKEV